MGLGKTIEAGLLLAQKWAERNRASKDLERRKDELFDEVQRRMLTYIERDE